MTQNKLDIAQNLVPITVKKGGIMAKINRKSRKLNKLESMEARKKKLKYYQEGEGLYVFRNKSSGTLELPKPSSSGQKFIESGGEWEGDNYFMQLVQANEATFVREIKSIVETKEEKMTQEEKLILDQPTQVTTEGTVEHVAKPGEPLVQPLNENQPQSSNKQPEVLINESPMDGVEIMND